MSTLRIEPVLSGQISAVVSIPVQYRMQGAVPFDIRVNGLSAMFDIMPEEVRIEIARQIIEAEARNCNEAA